MPTKTIRNEQVIGSNPTISSMENKGFRDSFRKLFLFPAYFPAFLFQKQPSAANINSELIGMSLKRAKKPSDCRIHTRSDEGG